MGYQLEGSLLEVCTCKVICPCWVGEDPDGGTCDGLIAWHIKSGTVNEVDVSGLTLGLMAHIPGNVLEGNWRAVVFVDDKATPEQQDALLKVWTGQLGGPVADLAQLVGEVISVERASIVFEIEKGKGTLQVGQAIQAEITPLKGATGQTTTLQDTVFTTIPGSPAFVGKAPVYKVDVPQFGFTIDLQNHNAIQGSFSFQG
jgi:hypothetical protein